MLTSKVNERTIVRKPAITIQSTLRNREELGIIIQAAESVGMSVSAFTRFHMLNVAKNMIASSTETVQPS
ncbi:hypothetical protein [Kingella pumchi]|uniref:hypothetical protein n=1 Tax=Kingella pumchi TaxID=2779506 RepID=UPI001EE91420|nr:hypothetical protein [Kingella pumchi]